MRLQALQQKGQRRRHGPEVVYGPGMPEKILPKGGGAMPDQQPGAQQGRCLFARGTRPGQPCHQQQKKQKDQDVAAVEQQLRRQREKLNAGQHRDPPAVGHGNAFLGEQNIPKPLQPTDREQGAVLGIVQAAGIEIVVGNQRCDPVEIQEDAAQPDQHKQCGGLLFDILDHDPRLPSSSCGWPAAPRGAAEKQSVPVLIVDAAFIGVVSAAAYEREMLFLSAKESLPGKERLPFDLCSEISDDSGVKYYRM